MILSIKKYCGGKQAENDADHQTGKSKVKQCMTYFRSSHSTEDFKYLTNFGIKWSNKRLDKKKSGKKG